MKWFKRTWLSIVRRPFKTLLLFLVIFVMVNLLAGSLAIVQTSNSIKQYLRESIAPKLAMEFESYYEIDGRPNYRNLDMSTLEEYLNIARKISKHDTVVNYEEALHTYSINAFTNDLGIAGENDSVSFSTYGINVIEPSEFVDGNVKMASSANNRFFTQEEIESDELIIVFEQGCGAVGGGILNPPVKTGLTQIGNTVTLSIPYYIYDEGYENYTVVSYKFEAKVIGVVTGNSYEYKHRAYMPQKAMMKVIQEANEYFMTMKLNQEIVPHITTTNYSFNTIEDVEEFDIYISNEEVNLPDYMIYEATSELYRRNVGPVETLDTVAKVIFVVAIVATIAILGLIIVFLISERKQEMGVYVSLGEKTKHVVCQVLCEVILVATLSISFASVSGLFLGNKLSDYMLEIQRYVQRQQNMGPLASLPVIYKPIENGFTMQTRDEVIDNFEITPSIEYFVTVYSVGEISIIVSCIVPLVYLTKLKPKEIML